MSFAGWVLFGCGIILIVGWCCFVMGVLDEMRNQDNRNDTDE